MTRTESGIPLAPDDRYRRYLELQRFVGWTAEDAARVHALAPLLEPYLPKLVDEFYRALERHPDVRQMSTAEQEQLAQAQDALLHWLRAWLTGPHDPAHVLRGWEMGRRHRQLGLGPVEVQAALARLRSGLLHALEQSGPAARPEWGASAHSLNRLLDLELSHLLDAWAYEQAALATPIEPAFQALVEAAPCMVIILTAPDQSIVYFNPYAAKVTGYTASEVLGKNFLTVFNGPELVAGMALPPGTEFEVAIRCKGGTRRWVLWNQEHLTNFQGRPANLLMGLDRTELREIQQRAWQTERLAELGVLASGLAHEIRNPLNSIRFNLVNLQDSITQAQTDPGDMTALVKDIADEVDRLEGIMRDFLHLARPDPAHIEAVEVRALVESIARLVEGPCRAQRVDFTWDCMPQVWAAADPHQLKQVLLNLVLNAQQAMPQGGRLELRCRTPADSVQIEVSDTGPGIPDDIQDKLFQPFVSTKREGTGLGLSICRRLVEQMHGRIEFTTAPGQGTTFIVRLPRAAPEEGVRDRNDPARRG